jgi:hypothetical protein
LLLALALRPFFNGLSASSIARFHWIMYVFGAILIYTVRRDSFIVYTSNIFAILGLRVMYFLLLRSRMFTRRRRITMGESRLKVIRRRWLGFALVLLSMFFFYFARVAARLWPDAASPRCVAVLFYVSPTAHPSRVCIAAIATHGNSHALGAIHHV